jgi:FkbM family methyltransferase
MTFGRCAAALGRTPAERVTIFWRLTKNLRARVKLATHHPARIYALDTALGRAYLRDNVGDITNLWGLWVNDVYHVRDMGDEPDVGGEVLDVGANIGLFAAWAARHLPGATIHCFEPLPSNLPLIERNCPGARVNAVALGARSDRVRMHVDLQGSIASRIDTSWDTRDAEFEVIPLDSYVRAQGITKVAMLKVDVEGMELDVLDGAHETLAMTRRVAIETHGPEQHEGALNRLRDAGFATEQVVREGATGMIRAMRESPLSSPDAAQPKAEVVAWGDRATLLTAAREPSIPTPIANGNAAPRPLIGDPPDAETRPR